ncbi:MAG: LCP family protein [Clostridia bacterium]|nr:LCP family protein [Clostridia bacterium]
MKNLRNFGIIFAVSLVVLGIIALFACGYVADTVCSIFTDDGEDLDKILKPDAETTSIGNEGEDDRFTRNINGESFTWLMVVSDYRPSVFDNYYPQSADDVDGLKDFGILDDEYKFIEATSIVLVHANVEAREYIVMSIPSATKVSTPAGDNTLGKIYSMSGMETLAGEVSSITGMDIDYYSVIHSSNLEAVANTVGSIECNIPVDIAFDGKNYVSLPPELLDENTTEEEETTEKKETSDEDGETESTEPETTYVKALDKADSVNLAKKLPAALLYYDDTNGIDDEMLILQSFANGLLTNLSDKSDGDLTSAFSSINKKLVKTNITKDDVLAHTEVIRAYSWFKVQIINYHGKFVSSRGGRDGFFNPDTDAAISFFADYR